jgi:hypothetical protein
MAALRRILKHGNITINERTMAERRQKYELILNPVKIFVETAFDEASVESSDFTTKDRPFKHINYFVRRTR